jgi:hypothetical protein
MDVHVAAGRLVSDDPGQHVELCLKAIAHLIDPEAELPEDHDRVIVAVE